MTANAGLMDAAVPSLYRTNPFRLLNLPVDASTQDVARRTKMVEMSRRLGAQANLHSNAILPLKDEVEYDPSQDGVDWLKDPESRLRDELFWFWPLDTSGSDRALDALRSGDISQARKVWESENGPRAQIAGHNLAVLYHVMVLDKECDGNVNGSSGGDVGERKGLWKKAYEHWSKCRRAEAVWDRMRRRAGELDDPRLTRSTVASIQESLPLALLSISAKLALRAAEAGDTQSVEMHLKAMRDSGFGREAVDDALGQVIRPLRETVKIHREAAGARSGEDAAQGFDAAMQLIEHTRQALSIADALLPPEHPAREAMHDDVALQALTCQIAYGHETDNWVNSERVLELALAIAASGSARSRIDENLKIVNNNRRLGTCWFCETDPADDSAAVEVKMHGEVTRFGTRVEWKTATIKVPRCAACKGAHSRVESFAGIGCLGGFVLAGGVALPMIGNIEADWGIAVFVGVVAGAVAAGVMAGVAKLTTKRKTKGAGANMEYPRIKELRSQGWEVGEKPAGVS